uniref:Uncharacterized protein n=1 Tax=Cacopsylla melanoneura TaxID=428564 RepID=A0A8D8LD90_9HEMI
MFDPPIFLISFYIQSKKGKKHSTSCQRNRRLIPTISLLLHCRESSTRSIRKKRMLKQIEVKMWYHCHHVVLMSSLCLLSVRNHLVQQFSLIPYLSLPTLDLR